MSQWTAFVDESGCFEPHAPQWLPGMRLVGGILLPLAPDSAEDFCRETLQKTLAQLGITEWLQPLHAKALAHPADFLAWLRKNTFTEMLRELAASDSIHSVRAMGIRFLRELRKTMGHEIKHLQGFALGVCEYGNPRTSQGHLGPLPYQRMLHSWLEHAVFALALRQQGPLTLHALVASRPRSTTHHASVWAGRFEDFFGPSMSVNLSTAVAQASSSGGLQMADLLVHGLGPGVHQKIPPDSALIGSRTEHGVRQLVKQKFQIDLQYIERDALVDFRHVNDATLALEHRVAFTRIEQRANDLPLGKRPDGTFPASLQACATTVTQLGELCK